MSTKNINKILNRINNKFKIRGNNKSGDQYDMFWPQFLLFAAQHEIISISIVQQKFKNIPYDRVKRMLTRLVKVKWATLESNEQYYIWFTLAELKTISLQGWSFSCHQTGTTSSMAIANKHTHDDITGSVSAQAIVKSQTPPTSSNTLLHSVSSFPNPAQRDEPVEVPQGLSKMDYVNQYYEIVPHFESDLVWDLIYDQVNEYTTVYDIKAKADDRYVVTNIDRQTARQILDLLYFQYGYKH